MFISFNFKYWHALKLTVILLNTYKFRYLKQAIFLDYFYWQIIFFWCGYLLKLFFLHAKLVLFEGLKRDVEKVKWLWISLLAGTDLNSNFCNPER